MSIGESARSRGEYETVTGVWQRHMVHNAYINKIGCAVPRHDFHRKFVEFAPLLLADDREKGLFRRMADRSQIEHRYSVLMPSADPSKIADTIHAAPTARTSAANRNHP